jgi:hypothetical protein
MKFVNLLGPAYVNGALRHPHEGSLHLSDEEAERLIKAELAEDVTDDFPADAVEKAPAVHIAASDPSKAKAKG